MTCEQCEGALGDYIDGTLGPAARAEVDAHLRVCPSCAGLAEDLARIRQLARSLDRLQPPAGAWTRIARELRLPGYELRRTTVRSWTRWAVPLAAAACLILAAVTVYLLRPTPPATPAASSTRPEAPAATRVAERPELKTVAAELQLAEQHYENAIAGLEKLANDREVLDPQVAAALQKNLLVIDQAIAESRAAVKARPDSEQAQQSLFEAFRNKIALLQDTIALINEMRKGNDAGAARIVEGLGKS